MSGPRIEARKLRVLRAGRAVLDDVTLSAEPARILAVTGPSGSGKTTLLAVVGGLDAADAGTVSFDGRPATGLRRDTGLVLQSYALVSALTAAENVEVALHARGTDPAEVSRRTDAVLDAVGLTSVADHLGEELSGGQQQRVAVARALVIEPDLLLADEPTAQLDLTAKRQILDLVVALARRGTTVLLATHDNEVAEVCDEVVALRDGRRVDG